MTRFAEEYRDPGACRRVADAIARRCRRPVRFMEVCGGHTMAIHRFGIPSMLPPAISLLSGPGCPVCVSDKRFIDHSVALARRGDLTVATFGDLIRVPGSSSSLEKERARGADIKVVYSSLEALAMARENSKRKIVFLAIGFETTAPTTAAAIREAARAGVENFLVLSAHKIMPPAMEALVDEGVPIDGYICPGHVSVITGSAMYEPLVKNHRKACVISGFEPLDILLSIEMLVEQVESGRLSVQIEYRRAVKPEGNVKARAMLDEVFEKRDDVWRGLGSIAASGLGLREKYRRFDAARQIDATIEQTQKDAGCICGQILKGLKSPHQCPLFAKTCTPSEPVGACMVSSEGTCAAHYKYKEPAWQIPSSKHKVQT
jgi:hydrogenase expression/formation protein HypD